MEAQVENTEKVFKDCAKRVIQLGQYVAATQDGYTYCLHVALVIGFTPKKIKIKFRDGSETTKFGTQLAII